MEKFLNLSEEKQNNVINAALKAFGANGYKKASISDIAKAAGISKSMVFHYFGSKKALYLYLLNFSGNILFGEIKTNFDIKITDFFDRIRHITKIKVAAMKKYPSILIFLNSVYFETDLEVEADINNIMSQGELYRQQMAFDGMDTSKFKTDVDPQLVMKILMLFSKGYLANAPVKTGEDIDAMLKELDDCINLMKNNFYKEEYI